MNRYLPLLAASLLAGAAVRTEAAGAPPPGRLLAAQCAQCHGTDGRSVSGIEGLAGEAGEIREEMREMRGAAARDIMAAQAHGYTDQEIDLIANYFAGLPGGSNGGGEDGDEGDDHD